MKVILKGESEGHPFRGNQYDNTGAAIASISDKANAKPWKQTGAWKKMNALRNSIIRDVGFKTSEVVDGGATFQVSYEALTEKLNSGPYYFQGAKKAGNGRLVARYESKNKKHFKVEDLEGGFSRMTILD